MTRIFLIALSALIFFPTTAFAEPTKILTRYVQALTNGNTNGLKHITTLEQYRNIVDDNGAMSTQYGFLSAYGNVKEVVLKETNSYSDFAVYTADVSHSLGVHTSWLFRLDSKGERIANAVFVSAQGELIKFTFDEIRIGATGLKVRVPRPTLQRNPCAPAICVDGTHARLGSNEDVREVEFLFATDRKPGADQNRVSFSGFKNPSLSFGAITVRIPEGHGIGNIELPKTWKLFTFEIYREKQNDKEHFSLKRTAFLKEQDFDALVRQQKQNSALIFVHGFNNSFEDAVYRNAQMLWDLKYKGVAVLYAWSTKGDGITDYGFDRDSALFARDGFIKLVQKLQNELKIERIDVLAHSMGNLIVVDALSSNAFVAKPVRLDQLVMAAPDMEREGFTKAIPVLKKMTKGMTLYASSADKALAGSAFIQKYPRAGDVPPEGPIVHPDLDTIDVSKLGEEFLGLNHATFAQNRAIMNDLKFLLFERKKSPRLLEIQAFPAPPKSREYWRFE